MYLAVDIGGTKTLLAVFSENGELQHSVKFPTPPDYDKFISDLSEQIQNLDTKDFHAACVAAPGKVDRRHGRVIAFGNLPWQNIPLAADIEKITNCPVIIENDANLAGLSEARLVIDEYKKTVYITVSTGIGGVYIIDGKFDKDTLDAEVGHMLLEHNDKLMYWEEFASGKAIVKKFGKKAAEIDPDDHGVWYEISRNLAVGIMNLIAIYTPEAIVIGGGVGSHFHKFKDRLNEELKIYEHPMVTMPAILQAKRPEEAVIYGCFELAKDKYGRPS